MNSPAPTEQIAYFRSQQAQIVDTIQQIVEIESPTDVKAAVDRLTTVLASRFGEIGGKVKIHHQEKAGNHLQIDFPGAIKGAKPVLLLGHTDTVYPIGTISKMKYRVAKGRVFGPGVLDMKGGIALALHVLEAMLLWHKKRLPRAVTVLLVSDEETGSASSRALTEALAGRSEAVFVLEPGSGLNGAVKTARKGVGGYTLQVSGKAAHSGLDFEKGQSAVIELVRQILELSSFSDFNRGITLNVGKISGGTRVNVVPAEASAALDLRVATLADAAAMHRRIHSLKAFNPHCQIAITGEINRPPMQRTAAIAALYEKARSIAGELGFELEEAAVGGGSDGNFTAALGVPTLDGLGAVGEGAHAVHESIVVSELPKRAALLAGILAAI